MQQPAREARRVQTAPCFTLRLAKEDFKFAAAHFTLFPDGRAELLHGHNYRVRVELCGEQPDAYGLLVEAAAVKANIREACARLDEHTLIPAQSRELDVKREGTEVEVRLGARSYRLPADDVALLPLPNVTVELLARLLWQQLAPSLAGSRALLLRVEVEESAGQSCAYEAALER